MIVLDAGDEFQGSLFFTTYSGQAEAEFMNRIGFDAMVFGNHEFDLGNEPLARFIETVDFPVISGSVDVSGDNQLAGLAVDHVILDIGGEKVGDHRRDDRGHRRDLLARAESRLPRHRRLSRRDRRRARGAGRQQDHCPHPCRARADLALAAEVPGIDLIVGGHSHTLFSNSAEGAPIPIRRWSPARTASKSRSSRPAPIRNISAISSSPSTTTASVTAAVGDTILLDKAIEPDAGVLARIGELRAPIEELKEKFVSTVAADIDGSRETCRAMECPMGNLVADAILDRVKGQGVTIACRMAAACAPRSLAVTSPWAT